MKEENTTKKFNELKVNQRGYEIASYLAVSFALLFLLIEFGLGQGINYGLQAIIFALNFGLFTVRSYYMRKKVDIIAAVSFGILVILTSYIYISDLIALTQ